MNKPKLTLLISALALLIASCGSLQSFEKRRYMKGFYVNTVKQSVTKATEQKNGLNDAAVINKSKAVKFNENKTYTFTDTITNDVILENNKQFKQTNSFLPPRTKEQEKEKEDARVAKNFGIVSLLSSPMAIITYLLIMRLVGPLLLFVEILCPLFALSFFVCGIIAFIKGRRLKRRHVSGEDYEGKRDAMFAYKVGWVSISILTATTILFILAAIIVANTPGLSLF